MDCIQIDLLLYVSFNSQIFCLHIAFHPSPIIASLSCFRFMLRNLICKVHELLTNVYFFYQPCEVKNATQMECKSPSINVSKSERIDPEEGIRLDYGFIMDLVSSVRNLNREPSFPSFLVYPNPVYDKFIDDDQVSKDLTPK